MGWVVNDTHRPLYTRERTQVPNEQEAGWAPGTGLDGCGKSRLHTGIRSPDRPARNESLYRQTYPGPKCVIYAGEWTSAVP